jgi:hypothetical protein
MPTNVAVARTDLAGALVRRHLQEASRMLDGSRHSVPVTVAATTSTDCHCLPRRGLLADAAGQAP